MSSPSLYKSGFITIQTEEARIIDSNERLEKRLQELQNTIKAAPKEFIAEGMTKDLEAASVAKLLGEDLDREQDGFSQGVSAEQVMSREEYAGPSPEELLMKAERDAEAILQKARDEAARLKSQAEAEGKEAGRQAGYEEAVKQAMAEFSQKEQKLLEKEALLEKEYQEKIKELEPVLIDTLTDIYEHIFKVNLKDEKNMITHLLEVNINKVGGRDFIIHVSKEDYESVSAHKSEILKFAAGENSTVEVIEDMTLSASECMIETEGGIFDCSLGVQLEELSKQLRLLSYERN